MFISAIFLLFSFLFAFLLTQQSFLTKKFLLVSIVAGNSAGIRQTSYEILTIIASDK